MFNPRKNFCSRTKTDGSDYVTVPGRSRHVIGYLTDFFSCPSGFIHLAKRCPAGAESLVAGKDFHPVDGDFYRQPGDEIAAAMNACEH